MSERSRRRLWAPSLGAVFAALAGWATLSSQCSGAPAALPDKPTAAAILVQFRQMVWSEPIYAEFDLRQMPRRGDETVFRGRFWGARDSQGPVTRLEIDIGKGGFSHRFLVQGGYDGSLFTSDGPGAGVANQGALLSPLAPGAEMTPLDVLPMQYLYWMDANLVGITRIRGRSSYAFDFTPSADFLAGNPGIRSVRAYLDTQYDALVQSETTGRDGHIFKTLSLLELKKVGDRWIPKDMDVRNEVTRDKTRLTLTAVAIGIPQDPRAFDPAELGSPLPPPSPKSVIRLNP